MSGPRGPVEPLRAAERPVDPELRTGHVHLRTADAPAIDALLDVEDLLAAAR